MLRIIPQITPSLNRQILTTWMVAISSLLIPQLSNAQMPPIVDPNGAPKVPTLTTTAIGSKIKVSCQNLKTIVQKEDRQAVLMSWNTNYFGKEFSNNKRCQMVSERLQRAANLNGGTFQGLELASGVVNFQPVICSLQSGRTKCDRDNLLFTLKPENAANPEVVIQQIMSFAEDGSGSVEESTRPRPRADRNLGNWERKNFPKSNKPASTNKVKPGGF